VSLGRRRTGADSVPARSRLHPEPDTRTGRSNRGCFYKAVSKYRLARGRRSGGLGKNTQLNAIRRGAQLVIATSGRLEDFLDRGLVSLNAVEMLVLDEADRMLDMRFLPAIERILSVLPRHWQSLFFSATMEKHVERLIARHSKDPVRIFVDGSKMRIPDQIDLHVYEVEDHVKLALLRHMLRQNEGSFLVFARSEARDGSTREAALKAGFASHSDARQPDAEPAESSVGRISGRSIQDFDRD